MEDRKSRVYAYKMLENGYHESSIALLDTPENICAFVASREPLDRYVITDIGDNFILSSMGSFLDRVNENVNLQELHSIIIPMQMGEADIPEVNVISLDEYMLELDQELKDREQQEIEEEWSQQL